MTFDKDIAEKLVISFDFSSEIDAALISTCTVNVALIAGTDASPNAVLNSSAQIVGNTVLQSVKDGVIDAAYKLRAIANLNDGRVLVRSCVMRVKYF